MSAPKFALEKDRYDQGTYFGRVQHFAEMVDPRLIFVDDAELARCRSLLDSFKAGTVSPSVTDADLWYAKKVRDSVLHPTIGEKIPLLARMSFFAPANVPITAGMLTATSIPGQLFFQFVNQSYNAMFNYANRSSKESDNTQLAISFASATSVACGVAFGLKRYMAKATFSPPVTAVLSKVVPFIAVASAGGFNAVAMRYREAIDGVEVLDADGNSYGKSVSAGQQGLVQVALTRVALPVPVLLLPPACFWILSKSSFIAKRVLPFRGPKFVMELGVISACLLGALPLAVAIFPQVVAIPASSLEPKFQSYLSPTTKQPITTYYFNKGV